MIRALSLILLLALSLGACGEDEEGGGPFSFTVTVVDEEGAPLEGLQVARISHYDGCPTGEEPSEEFVGPFPAVYAVLPPYPSPFAASCAVVVTLLKPSLLKMSVYDVRNRPLRTLIDETVVAGVHRVDWAGMGPGGAFVPDGVYRIDVTAREADTGIYGLEESVRVSFHGSFLPERAVLGLTDASGQYRTEDILLFPGALMTADRECWSADAEALGRGSFSDSVTVGVRRALDEPVPGVYEIRRTIRVDGEAHRVDFVWEDEAAELLHETP